MGGNNETPWRILDGSVKVGVMVVQNNGGVKAGPRGGVLSDVITCNQLCEHPTDEPGENITAQIGRRLLGDAVKQR